MQNYLPTILNNLNLSGDELFALIDRLIEHDKWKTEKLLENRLRIAEINNKTKRVVSPSSTSPEIEISEEDVEFNRITSYGYANNSQIGKLAKTQIWNASNSTAAVFFARWKEALEKTNLDTVTKLSPRRLKTLLLNFLWAHGCASRMARWPNAPDIYGADGLKRDLETRLNSYPTDVFVHGYNALKLFWNELNDYNAIPYNSSLIADILDKKEAQVITRKRSDIKTSPLFEAFAKEFKEISLDSLEKYYIRNRKNFVKGAMASLKKYYSENVPEKFAEQFTQSEWMRSWHQHLPSLFNSWEGRLRKIKIQHIGEQREWENQIK